MTDAAPASTHTVPPLPDLVLYTRPGCHLCDDALGIIDALLEQRRHGGEPVPNLVERDITTNPDWERAFLTTIPVIEQGDRRLELATSPTAIRRFIEEG